MRKKFPLLVGAIVVCSAAAYSSLAYALPSNCHYHSDGRVHCIYQVPQTSTQTQTQTQIQPQQ